MTTNKTAYALGLGLLALGAAACETPEQANEPAELDGTELPFIERDDAARERATALTYDYLFDTEPATLDGVDDVWARRVLFDHLGEAHVRLTQHHLGVPVFGRESIVHLHPDGRVRSITDDFVRHLRVDTTPTLTESEAVELAVAHTGGTARTSAVEATELGILPRDKGARLVYRVRLSQFEPAFDPAMPVLFIDAHHGEIVWRYDDLKTVALSNADQRTYDVGNGTNLGAANIADSSDSIANDVHEHLADTLAYFLDTHGLDSYTGMGTIADAYVHYGNNANTAFWRGSASAMVFGDGDGATYGPFGVLDVVAHEFGHAVTEYSADLIYEDESGALNEATSDIFGAAVEAAQGASGDEIWQMGEEMRLVEPYFVRNMADPAAAGDYDFYPTRYTGNADFGGVHWNSGIANLFFYLLSEGGTHPRGKNSTVVSGIGFDNAVDVWYRALTVYMGPSTTFRGARIHTIQAATDLNPAWASSVGAAWEAVGVNPFGTFSDSEGGLSGSQGNETHRSFAVDGIDNLEITMSGGSGDADLYVRFGEAPTLSAYDCRPYRWGNEESCEFNPAEVGTYYVMVYGYNAYSDVTLTAHGIGASEVCDDGVDNDGDGNTDCDDSDCSAHPACLPSQWRIRNAAVQPNTGQWVIRELDFCADAACTEPLTGGTPIDSNSSPDWAEPDQAFDDDLTTFWKTFDTDAVGQSWIGMDFGTGTAVNGLYIRTDNVVYSVDTIDVQYFDDDTQQWVTSDTLNNVPAQSDVTEALAGFPG